MKKNSWLKKCNQKKFCFKIIFQKKNPDEKVTPKNNFYKKKQKNSKKKINLKQNLLKKICEKIFKKSWLKNIPEKNFASKLNSLEKKFKRENFPIKNLPSKKKYTKNILGKKFKKKNP